MHSPTPVKSSIPKKLALDQFGNKQTRSEGTSNWPSAICQAILTAEHHTELSVVAYCCITYGSRLFISPGMKHPHKIHAHSHRAFQRETIWTQERGATTDKYIKLSTKHVQYQCPEKISNKKTKVHPSGEHPEKFCRAENIPMRQQWESLCEWWPDPAKLCFSAVWQRHFLIVRVRWRKQDMLFSFQGIPFSYVILIQELYISNVVYI